MIYLYDNAITQDLRDSFDTRMSGTPAVRVIDPEESIGLAAQLQNDQIQFPIISVNRVPNWTIDKNRRNFTAAKRGVLAGIETSTNNFYYERSMPIELSYELSIITTRVADMDEIVKEILFKYSSMYFLSIRLPYECNRVVRFGVIVDDDNIERISTVKDSHQTGALHQTIIPMKCEGCVLVSYLPVKLKRTAFDSTIINKIKQ